MYGTFEMPFELLLFVSLFGGAHTIDGLVQLPLDELVDGKIEVVLGTTIVKAVGILSEPATPKLLSSKI